MKKFYKLFLIAFALNFILFSQAQTLSAGDIAFVLMNKDNPDKFAFVALSTIPAGEVIYFTDNGWKSDNTWRASESTITWTSPGSGVEPNTVVTYTDGSWDVGSSTGSVALSSSGDQIIAYQGNSGSPTFITAINNEGSATWQADATSASTSALPTGLTNGTTAIAVTETDNIKFNGAVTGNKSSAKSTINNSSNWTGSGNTAQNFSLVPAYSNTWVGSTSNTFSAAANWDMNDAPDANDNVIIVESDDFQPIISSDISINDFTVNSGGDVLVTQNGSLTINGNFSNNGGDIELRSTSTAYAAMLVSGSSSGDIIYGRYVNIADTDEWDLVGSPVSAQSINGISTQSKMATNGSSPTTYALGYYSNTSNPGTWTNYNSSNAGASGNLAIGKGYQMGTTTGGRLNFTGSVVNSNSTITISYPSNGTKWNLVANPFPTFINANTNANSTAANNFFSTNESLLHDSFGAIYGWDADGTGYTAYNNLSAATYISPGQGFFVAYSTEGGSGSLEFNLSMRTITGTGSFIQNTVQDEVEIGLYNGDSRLDYTKLFFIPGLTLGLDKGYDAGHFNQSAPMMTRLSEGDEGYGMVYNAMGQEHLSQEVTIPLEINQSAGTNFTVRLESSTADDLKIYLQDTFKNTLTLLNESAFALTAENDLSDVGRFNLITTPVTLSIDDITNNNQIRIYKSQGANYITVDGLSNTNGDVDFKLYNITGALVMSKTLDSNENRQQIVVQNLSKGVYYASLNDGMLAGNKILID